MKQILIIILLIIISIPILSDDNWTYYPVSPNLVRIPCCNLRIAGDSLYTIRDNAIWSEYYPDTLYTFDINSEKYYPLFPLPKPIFDYTVDDNGNIWILAEKLWKYDGDSLFTVEVFPESTPNEKWSLWTSKFSKSPKGDIFFGNGNRLYQISNGVVSKYYDFQEIFKTEEVPVYFMNNGAGNEMLWIDDDFVFWGAPMLSDSVIFMDLENPEDYKSYKFDSLCVSDSSYTVNLRAYNDDLFILLRKYNNIGIRGQYRALYSFKDENIKEIKLEYLEENYLHLLIHDFKIDPKGNLMFSISRFEPDEEINDTLRYDEIVFFDQDGNLIEIYPTPEMYNDVSGYTTHKYQYWGASNLMIYNNNIYAAPFLRRYHQGIIRLSPDHLVGIDDEEGIEGGGFKLVHISTAFPNPVKDFVTIKFFCIPTLYSDFEINVYDYLGREYENVSYEILDYNSREGWGHAKVSLELLPKGPKYVILKAQEETDCVNIMLY